MKEFRTRDGETIQTPIDDTYEDLDWANGWGYKPKKFTKCIELEHNVHTRQPKVRFDISLSNRGSENIVYCTECKYWYKYDCSD